MREEEQVTCERRDAEREPERPLERDRKEGATTKKEESRRDEPEEGREGAQPRPIRLHNQNVRRAGQASP